MFYQRIQPKPWVQPAHVSLWELLPQLGDVEADWHAVHVPGVGAGHRVNVTVGVHPDHYCILSQYQIF